MKILVLANRDIASNFALNNLLPQISKHDLSVCLSSSVGGAKQRPPELENLKFFEQHLFNELLFPLIAESRSESKGQLKTFEELGKLIGKPVADENAINSPQAIARVRALNPDLIVSIRYGGIIKQEIIDIPGNGVINLHSGPLPEYRGVMASFWAMLNDEKTLGTTLHYISDGTIDTGRIVGRTSAALNEDKSYLWHVLNLYPDGCSLLVDTINSIDAGDTPGGEEQVAGGQYFTFPTSEELHRFREKGFKLVDYQEIIEFAREYV